MYMMCL